MADKGGAGKAMSLQDWDQIVDDFGTSLELQDKWLSFWPGLTLLEQALVTILKKEVILAGRLLVFIEENSAALIGDEVALGFGMILEALRNVHSGNDQVALTGSLRENMMVMATAVAIVVDALHFAPKKLEGLVELFLVFINRPNYSADRHVRGLACDCLRELEMAYPCLLFGCVGHIHYLCRHEKTHANQSYTLLLTTILENLSTRMYTTRSKSANYLPILQNTAPLVPFSVPFFLVSSTPGREAESLPARELTQGNLREFRTVVALLLERPQLLTSVAMIELVSSVINISKALDLSGPTLKTHFSGLLYSYSPVLCHIVLLVYTNFMDSLDGSEVAILKRLVALAKDDGQELPFRLLAVHWLLGVETLHARKQKGSIIAPFASGLYPMVFDPLSLKAAKLGALARCAVSLDQQGRAGQGNGVDTANGSVDLASVILHEGLVSVSSYKWLPPWSTETKLAFHIFHKFLSVPFPHLRSKANKPDEVGFRDSSLFQALQETFVNLAVEMRNLVPNLVVLLDRLMDCDVHRAIGEKLLRTFNEKLLPRLQPNRHFPSYFPLLERTAGIREMPPSPLIEKVTAYIRQRVEDDADDEERVLWSRSTEVLGICQTVLLHNRSSRVFHHVAPLLAFLCSTFPDIEVRDSARLYLRMITSIPGNKLCDILKYGDERTDDGNAPQVSSLFRPPSLPLYWVLKQPVRVASYIHFSRNSPLVIRHSWSLVLFDYLQSSGGATGDVPENSPGKEVIDDGIKDEASGIESDATKDVHLDLIISPAPAPAPAPAPSPALRVMDARTSEIILLLRRHYAEIPDHVNGQGLRINVPCTIKYHGAYRQRMLAEANLGESATMSETFSSVSDSWPAIYAVVITFMTSGSYGPIPEIRLPFLLSEPLEKNWQKSADSNISENPEAPDRDKKGKQEVNPDKLEPSGRDNSSSIVPWVGDGEEDQMFSELVVVELEPKKPVPTLVDVHIVCSDDNGRGIDGQLESIPVSIEDLFVKPPVPVNMLSDAPKDYLAKLYDALWEACSGPGRLGMETFSLKDSFQTVGIHGSESVKLLEAQADRVVTVMEQYLADFVVAVSGAPLANMTKSSGVFADVKWLDEDNAPSGLGVIRGPHLGSSLSRMQSESSLQIQVRDRGFSSTNEVKGALGRFLVLILLPPCFHLLLRMEVADESTLVRIRTDHWPCLAHVDEYLEALITTG